MRSERAPNLETYQFAEQMMDLFRDAIEEAEAESN